MNFFCKALKMLQNDKNVILPVAFFAFWAILSKYLKTFHKIWKNLFFPPQISNFMNLWISKNSKIPQQKLKKKSWIVVKEIRYEAEEYDIEFDVESTEPKSCGKTLVLQEKMKCVLQYYIRPATKSKSPFKYVLPTIFHLFGIYNDHLWLPEPHSNIHYR